MSKSILILFIFLGVTIFVLSAYASTTQGTIDSTYKYAWSNNTGWMNFAATDASGTYEGLTITSIGVTGYAWSPNFGWINFGPGSPTGYISVGNTATGTLSGAAWGQNVGWIYFGGVSINSSGQFTGVATGDIVGSLSFNCGNCVVKTDWRPQAITFSVSNSFGFGTLSTSAARYATSDGNGSSSDTSDAGTLSVSSTGSGYAVTVNGSTLTSGANTIAAIGGAATASSPGSQQFGMRLIANSGIGSVSSPYNTSNWALDTANFPSTVVTGPGDGTTTNFGIRYICNISSTTKPGSYASSLVFVVTATF